MEVNVLLIQVEKNPFDGCKYFSCQNGGTCYVNGTDNVPKCSCGKGWTGIHCENETNSCNPNPCIFEEFGVKNTTTCTSSAGDYTCECPSGTSGKNCSINSDDCKRTGYANKDNLCNKIDKNANCSDGLNEYLCICSAGYTGDKCETYDACFSDTCLNGGNCSTVNNKFKCDCVEGYTGDKCQTLIDNCNPNPCVYTEYGEKKNATCTNKVADYACTCPSGSFGINCEINPDDCILNGTSVCNTIDSEATCLDGLDNVKCQCGQEYEGDECTSYNACFNVTCLNGATCETVDMQPVCTCAKGYTGTLCDIVVDNCHPNPCIYIEHEETKFANCTNLIGDYFYECLSTASGGNICNKVDLNATCSDGLNNYTCTCTDEYKGNQCQTYDACVYNHCENGNCSTVGKDFKCTCTKGWEGKNCEISKFFFFAITGIIQM
uniref:EGF-like domain-containing protein n=1 Tax=Panagrolaimus superbus TaxID=310955 RepID=A0A914XT73_9BILA